MRRKEQEEALRSLMTVQPVVGEATIVSEAVAEEAPLRGDTIHEEQRSPILNCASL